MTLGWADETPGDTLTTTLTRERPTCTRPPGPEPERRYVGLVPIDLSGGRRVLVYDGEELVGPLPHALVRHSPDGFSWGYGGSGPSELALNLIINALGDEAWCPQCHGDPSVTFNRVLTCPACNGERTSRLITPGVYTKFKNAFVADWPQDGGWEMARGDIVKWVRAEAGW